MQRLFTWCLLLGIVTGCGEQGANPPNLPEIQFEIVPQSGVPIRFEVIEIRAGGWSFRSLSGTDIVAVAPFQIFVENAGAPFSLTLRLLDPSPALVRYRLTGTAGPGATLVTEVGAPVTVGPTGLVATAPQREARVDICAPPPGAEDCSPFHGTSTFGVAFSGTIGDTEITRAVGRASSDEPSSTTPAVIFFPEPQDTLAAVIRAVDGRRLRLALWLNGVLVGATVRSGTVVIREDL